MFQLVNRLVTMYKIGLPRKYHSHPFPQTDHMLLSIGCRTSAGVMGLKSECWRRHGRDEWVSWVDIHIYGFSRYPEIPMVTDTKSWVPKPVALLTIKPWLVAHHLTSRFGSSMDRVTWTLNGFRRAGRSSPQWCTIYGIGLTVWYVSTYQSSGHGMHIMLVAIVTYTVLLFRGCNRRCIITIIL